MQKEVQYGAPHHNPPPFFQCRKNPGFSLVYSNFTVQEQRNVQIFDRDDRTQDVEHVIESALKSRSESHVARRIWHLAGVLAIFFIYRSVPELSAKWGVSLAVLALIPADFLRLKFPAMNKSLTRVFAPIMRKSELHSIAGTSYLIAGVFLLIFLFPPLIVSLSLLFLALADPAASYFGIRFGKHKLPGSQKSIEGSLAAFIVCLLTTWFFISYEGLFGGYELIVVFLGGIIGALAEALPLWKLDDNLSLPLLSALGLSLVFMFFGGL